MDEKILLRIAEALESIASSLNDMNYEGIAIADPVAVTTEKHDFMAIKAEII